MQTARIGIFVFIAACGPAAVVQTQSAPTGATPSRCTEVRELKARVEFRKRDTREVGTQIVASLIDPKGKDHELFAVPFPYNCRDSLRELMPAPFFASIECLGDDSSGWAKITSDVGNIHVDFKNYGPGPMSGDTSEKVDITIGTCERARIALPAKFPSAH